MQKEIASELAGDGDISTASYYGVRGVSNLDTAIGSVCTFCLLPIDQDNSNNYREVTSWVTGPKLDSPKLREQTGRLAHKVCLEHLAKGQAVDQPEMEL